MKPPFTPAFLLVFFQIEGIQDPLLHGQLHQLRQCFLIVLDLDAVAVPEGLQGIDHIGLVVQQDDLSVFYKEDIDDTLNENLFPFRKVLIQALRINAQHEGLLSVQKALFESSPHAVGQLLFQKMPDFGKAYGLRILFCQS